MLAHSHAHSTYVWQFDPPLIGIAAAAILYALGLRKRASRSRRADLDAVLFAGGLVALVVAFASPLAGLAEELFWAHMAQHVLLIAVAPPLIVLARPWSTIWRVLPLALRRTVAHALTRGRLAALGHAMSLLASPPSALVLFCGTLIAWHVPALYDATLRSSAIHELEHALFLATGLLFWSVLIDSPPFPRRLGPPARAVYATVAMLAGWVLALVLGLASSPLYSGYAELVSRPGGISGLADQHLAAGIMWVPGSIPFLVAILVFVHRWLDESAQDGRDVAAGLVSE